MSDRTLQPPSTVPDAAWAPRWWESTLLLGLVISLFVHSLFGLTASVIFAEQPAEIPQEEEGILEIAAASPDPLTEFTAAAVTGADSSLPVLTAGSESPISIQDAEPAGGTEFSVSADSLAGMLSGAGGGRGVSAGAEGLGLSGAGGEARFFGVEARGSRFAFVIDISGSMLEPGKLGALQAALIETIDGMLEHASFCVVMYSSGALPLLQTDWTRATDDNKQLARRSVERINASGPTNPIPAFEIVFSLKPRPDAIYFMTDGVFHREVEERVPLLIEQLNRDGDRRVPIHCITFVDDGSARLMRRIARQSSGSYTHVEAPRR
ncbi:MAG: VWA domain-containing protein [Planctomycetota bacterium]|nr:VWA domain-containing protein [Planctomycetota bacterium]